MHHCHGNQYTDQKNRRHVEYREQDHEQEAMRRKESQDY